MNDVEHDLRKHPEFPRAVLDGAPELVIALDPNGRIAYANAACRPLLGFEPKEMMGRLASDLVVAEETSPRRGERCGLRGYVEIRRADGDTLWLSVSASPLRLGSRRAGAIAFLWDETERRRTELRLSRKNDELEHTIRAVSHDLRSPLISVLGFSRLLREELSRELGEKGSHFLHRIEQAGRTMEVLIRELLDFSRIGHAGEYRTLVDPREVLLELRGELKPRLDEARTQLLLPKEPPLLFCDRTRLYQVFSNLIGNALDHMGPCDAPLIQVEVVAEGEWHHVLVQDNGRGIDPQNHGRVFEMFQALPGPDGRKGAGIGLAIVKKIAEIHGGRVFVDSALGCGATFHFALPRP